MALPRSPGNTSVLTERRSAQKRVAVPGTVYQTNSNTNEVWVRDGRPYYRKGTIITLPDGSKFKRATNYQRYCWEIQVESYAHRTAVSMSGGRLNKQVIGWDSGTQLHYALAGNPVIGSIAIPQDLRNEVVTKALNKIADQKINLGENLATFRQTLGMFTSRAATLKDALLYAKRRNDWKDFLQSSARDLRRRFGRDFFRYSSYDVRKKGLLKKSAESYLEYVYGLRPLMNDVYTVWQLLKDQSPESLLLSGKGSGQRTIHKEPDSGNITGTSVFRNGGTAELRARCSLFARIDPDYKGLRALNQLGLSNPLGLAWDLVPYSFVVDWFVPIGPVLYALSARAGLIFVDGSIACRNSEVQHLKFFVASGEYNNIREDVNMPGVARISFESFSREALGNWPLPGFWVDFDPLRGDRSLKALALAILRLK